MGFSQRLELRQSQALIMTPQLQQAIKMLQLSNLELTELVNAELEQNPLLEQLERDVAEAPRERVSGVDGAPAAEAAGQPLTGDLGPAADADWQADAAEDASDSVGDYGPRRGSARDFDGSDRSGFEDTASRPCTLREHLLEQIGADLADPRDRVVALLLLDLIDEAGYLRGPLDGVANLLGCDLAEVERVLARLQQFDPAGVFARSLPECLALQLRDCNRLDPAMQALLDNLPLVAVRNIPALLRLCRVDAQDLAEMLAEIKSLDPRPGLAFDPPLAQPVVPDILMHALPRGGWIVELNAETLPRVLVNRRYYARVNRSARSKADKEYLAERLHAANWLVKSLHQRAITILKVAAEIVRQQEAFFRRGVQSLRPLILRDIAAAIGMHESTVSRVTTNKYMATPRGTYELKYFFTSSIAAADGGDAHSAEAVRFRIKNLIDGEPAAETLSDERIVELLQREGVDIARRTVAKYRDVMRIPSSVQRRREKAFAP
ncbi:MAG TPA: RNA polymerase factor sigma-54 [Stellaceae bacterium]|nr:RNA polymerase factor sigma-54 [Stellaceae bacterium]